MPVAAAVNVALLPAVTPWFVGFVVMTGAVATDLPGVIMVFAPRAICTMPGENAPAWNITPLQDQQIGGLIMWVPAGAVLTLVALALIPAWLRSSDARHALWAHSAFSAKEGGGPE